MLLISYVIVDFVLDLRGNLHQRVLVLVHLKPLLLIERLELLQAQGSLMLLKRLLLLFLDLLVLLLLLLPPLFQFLDVGSPDLNILLPQFEDSLHVSQEQP